MKKIILSLLIIICTKILFAQTSKDLQTSCASSSQGIVGNATISYTVGEMVLVESYKKNGLFITNGILQPTVPGNTQIGQVFLDGEITVFPNPTPNILTIQYNILQAGKMTAQVFDAAGKRLITEEFIINSFSNKRYDLSKYANGAYVLLLQYLGDDGTTIKKGQYKVVKL
jgi:hypothetical protein